MFRWKSKSKLKDEASEIVKTDQNNKKEVAKESGAEGRKPRRKVPDDKEITKQSSTEARKTRRKVPDDSVNDGNEVKSESFNDSRDEEDEIDDDGEDTEEDTNENDKTSQENNETALPKSASEPIPLEGQAKFCQDRAQQVEKSYGQMCQSFGSITRKIARLRDKGDLLSKQVMEFAEKEKISVSTSKNLKEFSRNLSAIQDYRDAEIHRLESKVVKPLSGYGPKCKKVKQIIKTEQGAINKEVKQRKNLEKVREKKPGDAHSISAAETELKKAAADASIGSSALNGQMKTFEHEKLTDLKRVLTDFVSIELVFHAKALEYYSQCFENLAMVDEEMDLEEFMRKLSASQGSTLKVSDGQGVPMATMSTLGSTGMSSMLGSSSEYTSTGASYTYTYGESTGSSSEKRVRIQGAQPTMYGNDDDDEDDDDEDDDDDDDDYDTQAHYSQVHRR